MANFPTDTALGARPVRYDGTGSTFNIIASFTPTANLAINDVIELLPRDPSVQVLDFMVANSCADLVGTLGVLNAAKTGIATTWKAGVGAFQRADNASHLALPSALQQIGFLVTTAQTAVGGTFQLVLTCRVI
jgi:hypothetical protein